MAAWHASKMMVPAKQGLIVNVSSAGGLRYLFNVAYGVGKAAVSALSISSLTPLPLPCTVCLCFFIVRYVSYIKSYFSGFGRFQQFCRKHQSLLPKYVPSTCDKQTKNVLNRLDITILILPRRTEWLQIWL